MVKKRPYSLINPSTKPLPDSLSSEFELKLKINSSSYVIGVDEAGRGCLAGSVFTCACFIPLEQRSELYGIIVSVLRRQLCTQDSKLLNEAQREVVYNQLLSNQYVHYEICKKTEIYIDEKNILIATLEAMEEAVRKLLKKICFSKDSEVIILIDGNKVPKGLLEEKEYNLSVQSVIAGDSKVFSIAAASILAKVTRDREMIQLAAKYPVYNFEVNKGYGTRNHLKMITEHGPSKIHRLTYKPICTLLLSKSLLWPAGRSQVEIDPVKRAAKLKLDKNQLKLIPTQKVVEATTT